MAEPLCACFGLFAVIQSEYIIGTDVIELAEFDQVPDREFVSVSFVTCIHGLGDAKIGCDVLLGIIRIFSQIAEFFHVIIIHVITR